MRAFFGTGAPSCRLLTLGTAAAIAFGGVVAAAPSAGATPATGSSLQVTQHSPGHYKGYYYVFFGSKTRYHGTLSGSGANDGGKVILQQKRFPFSAGWRTVRSTTASSTGTFQFTVRPSLATRYRVKEGSGASTKRSAPVTYYVLSGGRTVGHKGTCSGLTCQYKWTFDVYFPASVARREAGKHDYFYLGQHHGSYPSTLRLHKSVRIAVKRRSPTVYRFTYRFTVKFRSYHSYYSFITCQRETEAKDGFLLPRHFGCGQASIPNNGNIPFD